MMRKPAVIIPYFGVFPAWMPFYLYTCKRNKWIDWYFFTDCVQQSYQDENLFFRFTTYADYCQMVSERLNIDFSPKGAYKLCDLKVFYGFIHSELLKGYAFWGHADVDVIWSDMKSFLPENFEQDYDVFSTLNDRISGHFALYRNNEYYRNLCFNIKGWKQKLTDERILGLDENAMGELLFPASRYIKKFYKKIMMKGLGWLAAWELYYRCYPFIHKLFGFRAKRFYFREQHTTPFFNTDGRLYTFEADTWFYKDGRITNDRVPDKEYMYLHFMTYKKNAFRQNYFWKNNYYNLPENCNYAKGVRIDKQGFNML